MGEAINVPLARPLKANEDLPHLELRCVLYDMSSNSYLSTFHIMGLTPVVSADLGKSLESQTSANCQFNEHLKNFTVTSDAEHLPHVCLLFEFVAYCVNNYSETKASDQTDNQVTVAWASLPITDALSGVKHKLKLQGGNPFGAEPITDDVQTSKKQGFLQKIFKAKEEGPFERCLSLETIPFAKLTPAETQADICAIPSGTIVASKLVSFAAGFRALCFE